MSCPRCGGFAILWSMFDEGARVFCSRCLMCGERFGEPTLDAHHGLPTPPAPRPDVLTPVWDAERHRLRWPARWWERLHEEAPPA